MTITELSERFKAVKVKDTEILFRDAAGTTYNVAAMFYGLKGTDGTVAHPQVGDEPNCVIIQVVPVTVTPEA